MLKSNPGRTWEVAPRLAGRWVSPGGHRRYSWFRGFATSLVPTNGQSAKHFNSHGKGRFEHEVGTGPTCSQFALPLASQCTSSSAGFLQSPAVPRYWSLYPRHLRLTPAALVWMVAPLRNPHILVPDYDGCRKPTSECCGSHRSFLLFWSFR